MRFKLSMFEMGDVDVAFLTTPFQKRHKQIVITPLIKDNLVVIAPKNHSFVGQLPAIDLKELKDSKFILKKATGTVVLST